MPTSISSSVSRYRPAILVITGAAAAYAAYLIYSSVYSLDQTSADKGLHRSNAVRRPNARPRRPRTTRPVSQWPRDLQPLGELDFFGNTIDLDARNLVTPDDLRELAGQSQPSASSEQVEVQIGQFFDVFLDRLLNLTFPGGPLQAHEIDAVTRWLAPRVPNAGAVAQALERHRNRFNSGDAAATVVNNTGDGESIAATDLSWHSDGYSDDDELDAHGQTLQRTLYHIAEDRARQEGVIHRGITCNGCDTMPIRGVRWHCANCNDFDLCSDCKATNSHIKTHVFYEIRIPVPNLGLPKQEPLYPGRPHVMSPSINSTLKKRLVEETKKEMEEIEALWDTFTCLASTEWADDPNSIGWALDRRAFNLAFIPRYSSFMSAPNLVYDRIFAYYDSDRNGRIGFEEFVKGLAGMHSRDLGVKAKIVFDGYDIDGDGYISRKDVLRIFRAFYAIEKEATRNYLSEAAEELSVRGALDTIHSSQPLGSAFTQNGIPDPQPQQRQQKPSEESMNGRQVLLDDIEDTEEREDILRLTGSGLTFHGARVSLDAAVSERWARRQFYTDEEEGFSRPEGRESLRAEAVEADAEAVFSPKEQEDDGEDEEGPSPKEQGPPKGSRSSSRVRFQDDVDFETRSNASTSSRPIGERWGGYEIPEPEKDLGKEVLYQITQQGFNELLNPLFQEKEDNAMDARRTRTERRTLSPQIAEVTEEFKREEEYNKTLVQAGVFRYLKLLLGSIKRSIMSDVLQDMKNSRSNRFEVGERLISIFRDAETSVKDLVKTFPSQVENPTTAELWNARLCRMQLRREFIEGILDLAAGKGWLSSPASPNTSVLAEVHDISYRAEEPQPYRDPTMPQFRPNAHVNAVPDRQSMTSSCSDSDDDSDDDDDDDSVTSSMLDVTRDDFNDMTYIRYTHRSGPYFIIPAQGFENSPSEDTSAPASPVSPVHTVADIISAEQALSSDARYHPVNFAALNELPRPAPSHIRMPPPNRPTTPPPPHPPPAELDLSSYTNVPCILLMWIAPDDMALITETRPISHCMPWEKEDNEKPLERKIRRAALGKNSPLYLTLLASLEVVDVEISERKGAGLLSYEEFVGLLASNGSLRFLEAWMDWVSF